MKVLILSQVFWPDSASVSQHLTDLAEDLVAKGHEVSVISSRSQYEAPEVQFPSREVHDGIRIRRIWQTRFGKRHILGRLADFLSFNLSLFLTLLSMRRGAFDLVIGLTAPPLVSFIGVLLTRHHRTRFAYWAMDLQPELSIAAGYLTPGSIMARTLSFLGNTVYRRADLIVALDRYMAAAIARRGGDPDRTTVIPVWPVIVGDVYAGPRLANPFRVEQQLGDRLVIMYSGNHSVVHPLDTVLDTALRVRDDPRFAFVFIGGGVRKQDVTAFKTTHALTNILQLPYEPREKIQFSLAAADLQLVVLGDGCVGYTHPNKVYGAMFVGRPVLYVGPRPSHITELLAACPGNLEVEHGEADRLAAALRAFVDQPEADRMRVGADNRHYVVGRFTRDRLSGELISRLEALAAHDRV